MMKDLLVHLNGHESDETRLAYAEQLAAQHDAFLTGIYCNLIPEMMLAGDPSAGVAKVVVDMQAQAVEEGAVTEKALATRFARLGVPNELRRLDLPMSHAGQAISAEARRADLFVATRPYGNEIADPHVLETVLFNSGRGCLFVPPEGKPSGDFDTVMVAWRNSKESARALSEAMPLLQKASNVIVVMVVEDEPPEKDGIMPGADISRHLDRHGVAVELRHVTGWSNPAEALLNEVSKSGAQMLVMGGYGHSRFREWVLGGVTRDVLKVAEVPVLLAH